MQKVVANMLTKEMKWNHKKYLINPKLLEKKRENGIKKTWDKQKIDSLSLYGNSW